MSQPLPAKYPFSLYRGDTRVWEHHFTEDDGTTPIDISDWIFEATYRETPDSVEDLAVEDCEIVDGPGGVMRRTLTTEQAALLPAGKVAWDLQAAKPDGTVKTYLFNDGVKVTGDVTR